MLLAYFDEVKPQLPDQPYFWLGGLVVAPEVAPVVEKEMAALAEECFGKGAGLSKETEFHATAIANRTGPFKKLADPNRRFEILRRLIACYNKPEGVFRVTVRLDVAKLYAGTVAEDLALMFLLEKVDVLAGAQKTVAMLIGDLEKEKVVNRSVQNLHKYRQNGTPYDFGRPIERVIDTLHFAHSHHSRLLQLADVFLWTRQLAGRTTPQSDLRAALVKHISAETDTYWDHKYKHWPKS